MRQVLATLLAVAMVVSAVPMAGAQTGDEDEEQRCATTPDVKSTWQWRYNVSNGNSRILEIVHTKPATTPRGHMNITQIAFEEFDPTGQRKAWGELIRAAPNESWGWGLISHERNERTEDEQIRRLDSYDPPFESMFRQNTACPGERWNFRTHHQILVGQYGEHQDSANETWVVSVDSWTDVTVPAGTFEVLPINAVRQEDRYTIQTYWAPNASAPAKVVQGKAGAPELTTELTDYILNERPTARFKLTPVHPEVGDTLVMNGTPSFDPDGNVTSYHWLVNGETYNGSVVRYNATEEGMVDIKLVVHDDANRAGSRSTSRYVAPQEGSGMAVSGPEVAGEGEIVTLSAQPSFDPVEVRWKDGDTVVGRGLNYSFRAEETKTLTVDAFDPSGRVVTANHTVERVPPSQAPDRDGDGTSGGSGGADDRASRYPAGATPQLAILEPLEGQVVPQEFTVRLKASQGARLVANDRPLWQGSAPSQENVSVEMEPGRHTLVLESDDTSHSVNISVSSGGGSPGSGADGDTDAAGNATQTPVPGPSILALVAALAGLALVLRRRRR